MDLTQTSVENVILAADILEVSALQYYFPIDSGSGEFMPFFVASIMVWASIFILGGVDTPFGYVGHALFAIIFAATNILAANAKGEIDTEIIFREKVLAYVSAGYFAVDLICTFVKKSYAYSLHHLIALYLLLGAIATHEFLRAQSISIVLLSELSTPLFWVAATYKTRMALLAFLSTFFVARPFLLSGFLYKAIYVPGFIPVPFGSFHVVLVTLNILNMLYFLNQTKAFITGKYQEL